MIAQLQPQVTTASQIIYSYIDFDGVTVDVVQTSYGGGKTKLRQCWTEENLDGETVHSLKTSSGKVVQSNWRKASSNHWLNAYTALWYQRLEACQNKVIDITEQSDIEVMRAAQLAKADLGFDW